MIPYGNVSSRSGEVKFTNCYTSLYFTFTLQCRRELRSVVQIKHSDRASGNYDVDSGHHLQKFLYHRCEIFSVRRTALQPELRFVDVSCQRGQAVAIHHQFLKGSMCNTFSFISYMERIELYVFLVVTHMSYSILHFQVSLSYRV